MADKTYLVNEIYYTIHGEGVRMGVPHVFVRFSQCNLACGFCDTEYESGRTMTGPQLVAAVTAIANHAAAAVEPIGADVVGALVHGRVLDQAPCRNVLFCGGEPLLQLDAELVAAFKEAGWWTQIETNGTRPAPPGLDWITCSPKVAEHAIKLERAHELKYVRAHGQAIPHPRLEADHYLISPMFTGTTVDRATLAWCIKLVMENPRWRLTVQGQKVLMGDLR